MSLIYFPASPHWPNRQAAREAALARRREEYAALFSGHETCPGDLLFAVPGDPVAPVEFRQPDVEPPVTRHLTEAEIAVVMPRQFACFEVGGRPADDVPDWIEALFGWIDRLVLTKRQVGRVSGIVLTHGACVLLGMMIVVWSL